MKTYRNVANPVELHLHHQRYLGCPAEADLRQDLWSLNDRGPLLFKKFVSKFTNVKCAWGTYH